jgi:hypothetical protein
MADTMTLGKRRTIRFSHQLDRWLESRAAAEHKTVSDFIRATVATEMANGGQTAGEWLLQAAKKYKPRPADAARIAFQKAYKARHK